MNTKELKEKVNAALKDAQIKGYTLSCKWSGYTPDVTITVKITPEDIADLETVKKNFTFQDYLDYLCQHTFLYNGDYNIKYKDFVQLPNDAQQRIYERYIKYIIESGPKFNKWRLDRIDNAIFTDKYYNKLMKIYDIANQWNYDRSDRMTDYFEIGYYLDIKFKQVA